MQDPFGNSMSHHISLPKLSLVVEFFEPPAMVPFPASTPPPSRVQTCWLQIEVKFQSIMWMVREKKFFDKILDYGLVFWPKKSLKNRKIIFDKKNVSPLENLLKSTIRNSVEQVMITS